MADDKTKFVADDGYSEVPQPVKPEGGEIVKKKKGEVEVKKSDVKTPGQEKAGEKVPTAEEVETTDEVVEEVVAAPVVIELKVEEVKSEPRQVHSSAELFEMLQGTESDAPLCFNCGIKMRPSGSCHVCEGCGSTSGCS